MLKFFKEVNEKIAEISNGNTLAVIIALAAVVLIHITVSAILASSAKRKGHSGVGYFILCLFTGVIGYCITASLSDLKLYDLLNEALDRLEETDNVTYTDKPIAQTNDESAPEGVVAYIPTPKNSDTSAQAAAADRIEQFWKKNSKNTDENSYIDEKRRKKTAAKLKKAQKRAQKTEEREEKAQNAELKKLNKRRNERKLAQKKHSEAESTDTDSAKGTESADA